MRNPITAQRLREAMDEKHITAKELSEKAFIKESSISQWLHGIYAPRSTSAMAMSNVLGVSPMWLMGLSDDKYFGHRKNTEKEEMEIGHMTTDVTRLLIKHPISFIKLCGQIVRLNEKGIKKLTDLAMDLTEIPRYTEDENNPIEKSQKKAGA